MLTLSLQELARWCLENQPPEVWVNYGPIYELVDGKRGTEDRLAIFAGTRERPRAVALIGDSRAYALARLFDCPLALLALSLGREPEKNP